MSGLTIMGWGFVLLRILRVAAGVVGVLALLSSCSEIASGPEGTLVSQARIALGCVLLGSFAGIRWLINTLHLRRTGQPYPALKRFWDL